MDRVVVPFYTRSAGRFDELVDESGSIRPHWESMVRTWTTLGAREIVRRQMVAERLLVAEGAGHVLHDRRDSDGPERDAVTWGLDPVPFVIEPTQWRLVERGLGQRARLLDAVLEDLYGARRLLLDGVIPTAAVIGSRAYQLAAVGVSVRRPRLTLHAADLVRDSTGRWLVVRDHTDAPTGSGYALLNRTVLARLYPEAFRHLGVSAIAGWFADLRTALSGVAPEAVAGPRTILLGPEPQRPGFVEASYLATHLGYHLASGGDLITRGGRVWLRTLGGLEQVDVVFRRVPDTSSDPLELGPTDANAETGGVTGLLQAAREGNVGVANALGSGVADRLWLLPFLEAACVHLLGEPLLLPSIETWWCGDQDRMEAVRADPHRFVFHDTDPIEPATSAFGRRLSDSETRDWLDRMAATPHRYVVQPEIEFAATPVAVEGELRSGTASIRVQTVLVGDQAVVLPGGHGRHVAPGMIVTNAAGPDEAASDLLGKDVWVLTDPAAATGAERSAVARRVRLPQIDLRDSLPTRSAEALFWLGRNAEHAESATRTGRLVLARSGSDPGLLGTAWLSHAVAALRAVSGGRTLTDEPLAQVSNADLVAAEIAAALGDRTGAVAYSLTNLAVNAGGVREFLSTATWRLLNELDNERAALSTTATGSDTFLIAESLDRISVDLAAVAGLVMESMVRGPGWRFLDLGRRLERAVLLLGVIEAVLCDPPDDDVAQPVFDLVLGANESLVAYRRRYRSDVRIDAIEDLLVHDDSNPRSLVFQLDRINEHLAALPWNPDAAKHRQFLEAASRARLGDGPDSLSKLVLDVRGPLLELIRELMLAWFTHPTRRGLGAHR